MAGLTLDRRDWLARQQAHHERAAGLFAAVLARRRAGQRHPVEDFLFDYYTLRPGQLLTWHPGVGVRLADAPEFAGRKHYRVAADGGAEVDLAGFVAARGRTIAEAGALLRAVADRPPSFACFGMHEWAMVYGLAPDQTRHPYLPLRFPPDKVKQVVDEVGLRCSHFDACRFFTPDAAPLNQFAPTRASQIELDQPGCLHANMDLYKWAGKLLPAVDSEFLLDSFELARDIRTLDMAASAYDLRDWGYEPVPVEIPEGRQAYVRAQRDFSVRGQSLRLRLLEVLDAIEQRRASDRLAG